MTSGLLSCESIVILSHTTNSDNDLYCDYHGTICVSEVESVERALNLNYQEDICPISCVGMEINSVGFYLYDKEQHVLLILVANSDRSMLAETMDLQITGATMIVCFQWASR